MKGGATYLKYEVEKIIGEFLHGNVKKGKKGLDVTIEYEPDNTHYLFYAIV